MTVALCISRLPTSFSQKKGNLKGLKGVVLLRASPCRGSCGLNPPPALNHSINMLYKDTSINMVCINTVMVCNTRTSQKENTSLDIAGGDKGIAAHAVAVRNAAASEKYYSPI